MRGATVFTQQSKRTIQALIWIACLISASFAVAPARAQEVWQAQNANACFEQWIGQVRNSLNAYQGTAEFNSRKPWTINRFGLFVAKGISSNFEPDNWAQNGANRNQWMWNTYTSESQYPDWRNVNFDGAGLVGLRWTVRQCVGGASPQLNTDSPTATPATNQTTGARPALTLDTDAVCPGNMIMHSGTTLTLICYCAPGNRTGSVWGTNVYTSDSSLCTAAAHTGAVGQSGGMIMVKGTAGQSAYQGTSSNGVSTLNYGAYRWSYLFPGFAPITTRTTSSSANACPGDMIRFRDTTERVTCQCAPDAILGRVWGTGTYTDDSSICAAALHAGLVTSSGGTVSVLAAPGLNSYQGSVLNGITSSDYGRWPGSFYFP